MKFKFLKQLVIGFSVMVVAHANAALIIKDYSVVGDGLITLDSVEQMEWLDVSIFYGMNFEMLQGSNQWTADGFHLASDSELFNLYRNAGSTRIVDGTGPLDFGNSHTANSINGVTELFTKLGGGPNGTPGEWIHGILADNNNDGLSKLGKLNLGSGTVNTLLNTNGDQWGATGVTANSATGAFFVRAATPIPEPSILAIFALGILGLTSRRFKN
jgi:hypothetical protein